MFEEARNFDNPLNYWDVRLVENMQAMFKNANSFNRSLNDWDVSNVKNLAAMFNQHLCLINHLITGFYHHSLRI